MTKEARWLELTSAGGLKIYVNFDQVVVISPSDDGKSTMLTTSAGEYNVKEHLDYIQSKLLI